MEAMSRIAALNWAEDSDGTCFFARERSYFASAGVPLPSTILRRNEA